MTAAGSRSPSQLVGHALPAVVRTVRQLREQLLPARRHAKRVGLVPTMGALHDGHLSLLRQARRECDVVVLSLFVNPTQFNESRDLDAYPRDEERDAAEAARAGCDFVFAPSVHEMYPTGFGTTIDVGAIAQPLEGVARGPAHFRGVATVVAKLFNIVQPDIAYFGQKDAQQVLVVRQLVRDLDFGIEVRVGATVREPDGLALSSRNARLSPSARVQARALSEALRDVEHAIAQGERDVAMLVARAHARLRARDIGDDAIDYVAIVDAQSLSPVRVIAGAVLVAIAAHVGGVRLIDNVVVQP